MLGELAARCATSDYRYFYGVVENSANFSHVPESKYRTASEVVENGSSGKAFKMITVEEKITMVSNNIFETQIISKKSLKRFHGNAEDL